MATLGLVVGYIVCVFVGLLGALILWRIADGSIDLSRLISEPNGDASMSRFQFLVFTFVISMSLFLVIVGPSRPTFPAVIPGGILALLGISGSSYLVSKGIQFSTPAGLEDRPPSVIVVPKNPTVRYGQKQQFAAETPRAPDAKVVWEVVAGAGTIDSATGLFTAPATPSPGVAAGAGGAPAREHATIRVSLQDGPDVYDLAVITLA